MTIAVSTLLLSMSERDGVEETGPQVLNAAQVLPSSARFSFLLGQLSTGGR